MSLKKLLLIFSIIAVSCSTTKQIANQKNKNKVETFEYKNFKGERIEDYSGIAITRNFYKDNKLVSVKYFDVNDEPIKNEKSWDKQNAEWRFEYDENGNFTRQTAHDLNGELFDVEHWSNSAIEIFEFNDLNQLIKKSNFDKSMKLVGLGDIGDAITEIGYNKEGLIAWKKSFDAKEKFIKNGFCFSKFEYNSDGKLKKRTYFYDEDKINMIFLYKYKDGNLIQEETFDENGDKIGYEIYSYDKNGRIIKIEDWYHKWENPKIKKEEISLELEGWKIKKSELEYLKFERAGNGQYEIQINKAGEFLNIVPVKYKGGSPEFNNEVYSNFKRIRLVKEQDEVTLNGKLKVVKLHQEIGIIHDINRILNPTPYF